MPPVVTCQWQFIWILFSRYFFCVNERRWWLNNWQVNSYVRLWACTDRKCELHFCEQERSRMCSIVVGCRYMCSLSFVEFESKILWAGTEYECMKEVCTEIKTSLSKSQNASCNMSWFFALDSVPQNFISQSVQNRLRIPYNWKRGWDD